MKTQTLVHIGSHKRISPNRILKFVADVNYTIVYLEDGKKICTATTLGTIEKRLNENSFFRINRSTIINLQYLSRFRIHIAKEVPYGEITNTETDILLARRRITAFKSINKYKISIAN